MSSTAICQETLKSFTPFDTLHEEYLDRVVEKVELKTFPKGTLIFKRGKALRESFYLVEGHIDLVDSQFSITSIKQDYDERRFPLSDSSPTQVSAVAKSEVKVLTVERDFLDLVMVWSQSGPPSEVVESAVSSGNGEDDENDWMSCLLESPLFTQVPPANIQQLFTRFETLEVNAGEVVVREGDHGDFFYVIERGSARVEGRGGKVDVPLKAGHYFGEEALVGDTTRNASVTMTTNGVLMRLGKEDFKTLLQEPVIRFISVDELRDQQLKGTACQLLDVRLPIEHRHHHVAESKNIPLSGLRKRFAELNEEVQYVVTDDGGRRSEVAAHLLCQAGLTAVILKDADQHYVAP